VEENSFSPLTGILLSFAPPVGRIYSHLDSRIQGFFIPYKLPWSHIASSTLLTETYYVAVYHVFNVKVLILRHTSLSPFKKDDHQIIY